MTTQPMDAWIPEWLWSDKVRKVRRHARLSQKAFAEKVGVSSATVAAWEVSEGEVPRGAVAAAKRMELAFGVSAAWMLGLTDGRGPDGGGFELPLGISQLARVLQFPAAA